MKKKHPDLPYVRRVEDPDWMAIFQARKALPPEVQTWRMGHCYILLIPPQGQFLYRMTIACKDRYPTFDELWKAWNELVPMAGFESRTVLPTNPWEYFNVAGIESVSNLPLGIFPIDECSSQYRYVCMGCNRICQTRR